MYRGTDDCLHDSIHLELIMDKSTPNRAWLNGNDLYFDFTDQSRFEIPQQVYRGVTVTGEGQILINAISYKYEEINSAVSTPCHVLAHQK